MTRMGSAAERSIIPYGQFELLREARAILEEEAAALVRVAERLDESFCAAVELLLGCRGSAIVTGMGKAGLIGRKTAATLASTGTRAHFLHPAEAVHGDLGCLGSDDVLIVFSNSGETEEICRILPSVRGLEIPIVAITAAHTSTLGAAAAVTIELGRLREAGVHALAPSTSTTAMLAVGDALALVVGRRRGLTPQQFAVFHVGGSLGAKLKTVGEIMRRGDALRIALESESIREVFARLRRPGRRTGAVMLVDAGGRLSGLFTDSDLARLLEQRCDDRLDRPICESMTRDPLTIEPAAMLAEAIDILSEKRISELPVVDDEGRPIGLVDITDIVVFAPSAGLSQHADCGDATARVYHGSPKPAG
jgi:arabinose-5-phosphate isomerase